MADVIVSSLTKLQNEVRYGDNHVFIADEPQEAGGDDAGPDPYTLLLAALGSCIAMTVTLYGRRKGWPLERVTVRLLQNSIRVNLRANYSKSLITIGEESVLCTGHL